MSQCIHTSFLQQTDTKPLRVVAKSASGQKVTLGYHSPLAGNDPHRKAVLMLCRKLNWTGKLICGGQAEGTTDLYVGDDGRIYII